jgi:hypothetical protein
MPTKNIMLEFEGYREGSEAQIFGMIHWDGLGGNTYCTPCNSYAILIHPYAGYPTARAFFRKNGAACSSEYSDPPSEPWVEVMDYGNWNDLAISYFDGELMATVDTGTVFTYSDVSAFANDYIGFAGREYNAYTRIDNVRVRKYHLPEPAVSFGEEDSDGIFEHAMSVTNNGENTYAEITLDNLPEGTHAFNVSCSTAAETDSETQRTITVDIPIQTKEVFLSTGSDQTFSIPAGVTNIGIKMWGAGGGAGNGFGGGGGYSEGTLGVTPGEDLTIIVGEGGGGASTNGCGGGRSAVRRGTTELITAGAGGGAGHGDGGAGGGTAGEDGTGMHSCGGYSHGLGGTQSAGGSSTCTYCGCGGCPPSIYDGTQFAGGDSGSGTDSGTCTSNAYGGGGRGGHSSGCNNGAGGGSGYYGGGGVKCCGGGAGGGGSGYVGGVTGGTTTAGSGADPANTSDPDYVSGTGGGGDPATDEAGGNGLVVITYTS